MKFDKPRAVHSIKINPMSQTDVANNTLAMSEPVYDNTPAIRYDFGPYVLNGEYNNIGFARGIRNNNVTLDTTTKYFGDSSALFNGSSSWLEIAKDEFITYGYQKDRHSVDFWIKFNSLTGEQTIMSGWINSSNYAKMAHIGGSGWVWEVWEAGSKVLSLTAAGAITDTNWHHVMWIHWGNDATTMHAFAFYIDGQQVSYLNTATVHTLNTNPGRYGSIWAIGQRNSANYFNGYLDDLYINHGGANPFDALPNAGLTDTFTVPTAPHSGVRYIHPSISKEEVPNVFFDFDQNVQEEINDSSERHIFNNYRNKVKIDRAISKFGLSSAKFNGVGSFLTSQCSTDWNMFENTTDDWTLDLYVKHDVLTGTQRYIGQYEGVNDYWSLYHVAGSGLIFDMKIAGTSYNIVTGVQITDTEWHHIAFCKVASDWGLYLDGQQIGHRISESTTHAFDNLGEFVIGRKGYIWEEFFSGNLDEVRIVKQNYFNAAPTVGDTDTIALATESYVTDNKTKLLLHFDYTEIIFKDNNGTIKPIVRHQHSVENEIVNGHFQFWYNGTSVIPNEWAQCNTFATRSYHTGAESTYTRSATKKLSQINLYSIQMQSGTTDPNGIYQHIDAKKFVSDWQNHSDDEYLPLHVAKNVVTLSCWVKSSNAEPCAGIRLVLFANDFGYTSNTHSIEKSVYHTGSGNWEYLTVSSIVPTDTTDIYAILSVDNEAFRLQTIDAYFDGAMLIQGYHPTIFNQFPYKKHPLDTTGINISSVPSVVGSNHERAWYVNGATRHLYMCDGSNWKYVNINNA